MAAHLLFSGTRVLTACVLLALVSVASALNSDSSSIFFESCSTTWASQLNASDPAYQVEIGAPPQLAIVNQELVLMSTSLALRQNLQYVQPWPLCIPAKFPTHPDSLPSPLWSYQCFINAGGNAFSSLVVDYQTGIVVTQCSQTAGDPSVILTQSISANGTLIWQRTDVEVAFMMTLNPQRIVLRNYFSRAELVMVLDFASGATITQFNISQVHPVCLQYGGYPYVPSPGRSHFQNGSVWAVGCWSDSSGIWLVMNEDGAVQSAIDLYQALPQSTNFRPLDVSMNGSFYFTSLSEVCLLAPDASNASCTHCLPLATNDGVATGDGLLMVISNLVPPGPSDTPPRLIFVNDSSFQSKSHLSDLHDSGKFKATNGIHPPLRQSLLPSWCPSYASWCLDLTSFFSSLFPSRGNSFQLYTPSADAPMALWGDIWILLASDYWSGAQPSQLLLAIDAVKGELLRYRPVDVTKAVGLDQYNSCIFNVSPLDMDVVLSCSSLITYVAWNDPLWSAHLISES